MMLGGLKPPTGGKLRPWTRLNSNAGRQTSPGLREAKRLTQEQLGGRIGRSVDTVSNIERGINATRIEVAHQIAIELGVALPDLFAFDSENQKQEEREAVALLLSLIRDCDDLTLQSLTDLVRVGLAIHQRSLTNESHNQ